MTWDGALPQLRTDPRFLNSPLPINQQVHLFHAHIAVLRAKHVASLHALFESHTPSLATKFTDLPVPSVVTSLPATKLGFDIERAEDEFKAWQRERTHQARLAFDQMLSENAFVEFWGRLGKIGGKGVDEGIKADDLGDDAEEEQVDMKALAKNVDLQEMVKVLQVGAARAEANLADAAVRTTSAISSLTTSRSCASSGCGWVLRLSCPCAAADGFGRTTCLSYPRPSCRCTYPNILIA